MANVPLIRTMQIAAVIFTFGFIASGQTPAAEARLVCQGESSSRTLPLVSIPNRAVTSPPTRAMAAKARNT